MTNKVLNLDFSKDPIMMPAIIYGRVGDDNSQTVTVNVTKRNEIFDLTGGSLTFEGVTKGGTTQVFDSDNISTTTEGLKKGTFDYTFPNAAFAVEGKYERAYFSFVKDGKRDTTSSFEIIVFGNADIDAEEAETIITEYNKLIEQLHELYQQTIDKVTGEYDQFHQQITKKMNEMETVIQNANADLTALKTKVDEIKQIIENLDNLSVMYSNSIDFGGYDYSGNPNLMRIVKASDFHLEGDTVVTDVSTNAIHVMSKGAQRLNTFTSNDIPSLVSGKTYTISAKVKVDEGTTGDIDKIRIAYRKTTNGTILLSTTAYEIEVGKEITVKATGVVNYEITDLSRFYLTIDLEGYSSQINGGVIISDIKIEEGPTATPYQPNLLDDPYWVGKISLGKNILKIDTVKFPIQNSEYMPAGFYLNEPYILGQTYTFTMKASKPATQTFGIYLRAGSLGAGNMTPIEGLTDVWQLTFKVTQAHIDGAANALNIFQLPQSTKGTVKIEWVKLEKGDTRTPNIGEYKYRGTGMRDSNNPYDYVWDIEPSYVENNLATDIKVAEITDKANNYTDGKVAQVNSNLLTVINTLEKRVSTNSNNILDNTTKIGANTSNISKNTIAIATNTTNINTLLNKEYPYEADFYMGTNHNDAHYKTKSRMGWGAETNTIAERLGVKMKPCPLDFNSGRWNATFNRDCRVKLDVLVKVNGQGASSGHYCYIAYWKDVDQTVQWVEAQGIGQNADITNRNIIPMTGIFNAKKGDCISVALELAEGKTVQMQLLNAHFQELT
ncbi:TPA: BppU family phage baseplate upper protein [Enterococcus faecium]